MNVDEAEYYKKIAERIKAAKIRKGISQDEIVENCRNLGLEISQPALSRLLSGEKWDLRKTEIICKSLDMTIDELLSLDLRKKMDDKKSETCFETDVSKKEFQGYLGTYRGYFYSTKNDGKIHDGDFTFFPDELTNECLVSFRFETGEIDDKTNEPIIKEYQGTAKISKHLGGICCELSDTKGDGDVSYIIFRYNFLINQSCECKIGLVITICAGIERFPVVHKLLICRNPLSDEEKSIIEGQLKLNDSEVLISKSEYDAFKTDPMIPDTFRKFITDDNDLIASKASKEYYYSFKETEVFDSLDLPEKDKAKTVNLIRKYSHTKRCKKIGPKCEKYIYGYLKGKCKRKKTVVQNVNA